MGGKGDRTEFKASLGYTDSSKLTGSHNIEDPLAKETNTILQSGGGAGRLRVSSRRQYICRHMEVEFLCLWRKEGLVK